MRPSSELHRLLVLAEHVPHRLGDLAECRVRLHGFENRVHEVLATAGGIGNAAERGADDGAVALAADTLELGQLGRVRLEVERVELHVAIGLGAASPTWQFTATLGISPEMTFCSKRYAWRATSAWIAPLRTASTMPPMRATLASSSSIRFSIALVSAS